MQRRNFIKQICKASLVCAASASIATLQSCSDSNDSDSGANPTLPITEISIDLNDSIYTPLKTVGRSVVTGSLNFDSSGLLLFRESNEKLRAYSRRCPHAGTSINAFVDGAATCPNHGAKFNTDGSSVSGGPTNAPLNQYSVNINGSIATIYK